MWFGVVSLAFGFELNGHAWPEHRRPLEILWTGSQPGISDAELAMAVEAAAGAWTEVSPCDLELIPIEDPAAATLGDELEPGIAVLFGDPFDELSEGVLSVSYWQGTRGPPVTHFYSHGAWYDDAVGMYEFVFNDGGFWAADATLDDPKCSDLYSIQSALTRDFGWMLGLEGIRSDVDTAELEATMSWSVGSAACNTYASTLSDDDIAGIQTIYGAPFRWEVRPDAAALQVEATLSGADARTLEAAVWDLGDGTTAVGPTVSHQYGETGTYRVSVCVQPEACATPRCRHTDVSVGGREPEFQAWHAEEPSERGCITGGAPPTWLGVGAMGILARRRRRAA